jgi:hypothetical protein
MDKGPFLHNSAAHNGSTVTHASDKLIIPLGYVNRGRGSGWSLVSFSKVSLWLQKHSRNRGNFVGVGGGLVHGFYFLTLYLFSKISGTSKKDCLKMTA